MNSSRRQFIRGTIGSSALVSLTPTMPDFLLASAAQASRSRGEKILVVVQLSGGNDGLNTVIPFAHDAYQRNRFQTRIGAQQVLRISDDIGLHPALAGFSELLEQGQLSVLQGIGYPNPNRSHFESMDIWHTARRAEDEVSGAIGAGRSRGWLGRALDRSATDRGHDVPGLHLGAGRQPLALAAEKVRVPSATSLRRFRIEVGSDQQLRRSIDGLTSIEREKADPLVSFLQRSAAGAISASRRLQDAVKNHQTPVAYPGSELARQLRSVAQLIDAGLGTRIYYVSLGGFDTHSKQAQAHAGLLRTLGDAIAAFMKDLTHQGHADRVLVMTFSEFGRRVRENASGGTDHGAAAPMFLVGGRVKPGLIGPHPSLDDLERGDLKFHTDFRQVYAGVLTHWLGVSETRDILGGSFKPLQVSA
ncbi:MAG: DUF1501 domain-containing protein [Phycisphaerae bacterium]|nr:DUF1501 domain-containing protein [Phycisphaerae bacterium]